MTRSSDDAALAHPPAPESSEHNRALARWLLLAGLIAAAWTVGTLCSQTDQARAAVSPAIPSAAMTPSNGVATVACREGRSVTGTVRALLDGGRPQRLGTTAVQVMNSLRPASAYTRRLLRYVADDALADPASSKLDTGAVLAGPARLITAAQRLTGDAPSTVLSSRLLPHRLRQVSHWGVVSSLHGGTRPAPVTRTSAVQVPAAPSTATVAGPGVSVRFGPIRHRRPGSHDAEVRRVRPHFHRQMTRREPAPASPYELPSRGQNQGLPVPSGLGGGFGPASVSDQQDWAVRPVVTKVSAATMRRPIVRTIAGDRSFSPD